MSQEGAIQDLRPSMRSMRAIRLFRRIRSRLVPEHRTLRNRRQRIGDNSAVTHSPHFLYFAHERQEEARAFGLGRHSNSNSGLHGLHRIHSALQAREIRQEDVRFPLHQGDGGGHLRRSFNSNARPTPCSSGRPLVNRAWCVRSRLPTPPCRLFLGKVQFGRGWEPGEVGLRPRR